MANDGRPHPQPGPAGRLGPFRHAAYAIYWGGGFVSNLGTWLQAVAGSIFVYQLTGSSLAVGIFNFAGFIPILLFSVWGGGISDRFDRRSVVIATHAASMLIATVLAVITIAGVVTEAHLIVATFLINSLWAIGKPSLAALIPNIVPREDLQDAVGLNSLQFISGQIAGPALAALVMATAGAGLAFTINAVSFAGPIVAMVYLVRAGIGRPVSPAPGTAAAGQPAPVSAMGYVRSHLWVPALLVGVVASAAPMEVLRTLAPGLVAEVLHQPASMAGLLVTAQSIGSAAALIAFMSIRRRGWSGKASLAGFVIQGVGIVIVGLAPEMTVASIGLVLIGFGFSLTFPVLTAALQGEVPDALRGRVMALHQMAHIGNRPFTALTVGTVAAILGTQAGVLAGLVLVPIGLMSVRAAWRELAIDRAAAAKDRGGVAPAVIALEDGPT